MTKSIEYIIIYIQYKLIPGRNKFNTILNNLNIINTSIEELIDRCESNGLKLEDNVYLIDKSTGHERIYHTFIISFIGDEININDLKDIYNKYINFQDKEYIEGIKKLSEIYKEHGINFNDQMDLLDNGNYIEIGFNVDDDIYDVATYNKENKKFTIDRDEIDRSIESWISYITTIIITHQLP